MKPEDQLLLSDYLAGDLPEAQRGQLEMRLPAEPELAEALRRQRVYVMGMKTIARAEAKKTLRAQLAAPPPPARIRWIGLGSLLAVATFALLLLLWQPWQPKPDARQMALAMLEPYAAELPRSAGAESRSPRDSAFLPYLQGDYTEALPHFQRLMAQEPGTRIYALYAGDCLSLMGRYAEAAALFGPLASDSPFRDAASWRLALNSLLAGDRARAARLLETIAGNPQHYRHEAAKRLLARLRQEG